MQVTVGAEIYSIGFVHERDWTPPEGQHKRFPRHVRGRTICTITKLVPNNFCARHGQIRMPTGTHLDPPVGTHEPCICEKDRVAAGQAFCSKKDVFSRATGRSESLKQALLRAFPKDADDAPVDINYQIRKAFWVTYLNRFPQPQNLRHDRRHKHLGEQV